MRLKLVYSVAALLFAVTISGCAAMVGGGASTAGCNYIGLPQGAADVPLSEGPTSDGYLLRGKSFAGTDIEYMLPVAGLKLTVSGDGFTVVLCSDAKGEWGGYMPAAAPFTVAIHPESVPPGLHLRASSAYGGDSFVVEAQSLYPVQVSLNFAAGKTD